MGRYLFALVMLLHGAGHFLFVANSWGYWNDDRGRAFLFANILHAGRPVEGAAGIFWLIPLIGFVAAAQGMYRHKPWWRWLALRSAAVSIVMLIIWWGGLSISSSYAALAFNVILSAALLWGHAHILET